MAGRGEAIAETALQLLFHADNITIKKFDEISGDVVALAKNLDTEITRVKDFKVDIKWKTRVILVPKAIENFRTLLTDLTTGLRDKILTIAIPFRDFKAAIRLFGQLPQDPGVAQITRAFNELENFVAALNLLVGDVGTAIKNASEVVQLFDRLLQDIEHLDDLFLQQGNSRQRLHGANPRIRLGKLHS
jgi:hypothetical protein